MARDLHENFENTLAEGKQYYVANFQVIENSGSYKATAHRFKLVLSPSTYVMEAQYDIPSNPYTFMPIVDVLKSKELQFAEHLIGKCCSLLNGLFMEYSAYQEFLVSVYIVRFVF